MLSPIPTNNVLVCPFAVVAAGTTKITNAKTTVNNPTRRPIFVTSVDFCAKMPRDFCISPQTSPWKMHNAASYWLERLSSTQISEISREISKIRV
jgi:hypothetical protein